jgi:hypothetical protein
MAVTVVFYNPFKLALLNGTHDLASPATQDFKCMLLTSSYTPNIDTDEHIDDIVANEISGTGYTADGASLSTLATLQDSGGDRATWGFDDVTWATSTLTARYAVIYHDTNTAATSDLFAYIDFGVDFSSSGTTFRIEPASGLFLALS